MDVFLDNNEMPTDQRTLAGLLTAARNLVLPEGRFVVEVRIDGRTLGPQELDDTAELPLEAEEVQLITADPLELADQTLEEIGESLAAARTAQQDAAGLLRTDRAPEALEHIQAALAVWGQAQQAVQTTVQLLNIPLDRMNVGTQTVPQVIEQLLAQLTEVRTQLMASDWLGLADSLGHELDSSAQTWAAMLDDLRRQIAQRKAK